MSDQNQTPSPQKSYKEQAVEFYNHQYQVWVPWLEDKYLQWFTKDNKASYTTKQQLDKTKITGIEQVDTLQDGVHNLVGGQVGRGGLAQPVGDLLSQEVINQSERGGRDEQGRHIDRGYGQSAVDGVKGVGNTVTDGVKGVGGTVTGLFGGGTKN